MQTVGIVKQLDHLGRLVIPMEFRKILDIHPQTPLEISVSDDGVLIKKHSALCPICGNGGDLIATGNTKICPQCRDRIKEGRL